MKFIALVVGYYNCRLVHVSSVNNWLRNWFIHEEIFIFLVLIQFIFLEIFGPIDIYKNMKGHTTLSSFIFLHYRGAVKRPVGILHVKVLRARNLLDKDVFSKSDPYVTLSLGKELLPAKKTTVKMDTLNPEWNEDFKLTVKDPDTQILELHIYDWEKVRILISWETIAPFWILLFFFWKDWKQKEIHLSKKLVGCFFPSTIGNFGFMCFFLETQLFTLQNLGFHEILLNWESHNFVASYFVLQFGTHDKLGMRAVPLKLLTPYEKKKFTLDLVNSMNPNDPQNKKPRGQIVFEMTFVPFQEDSIKFTSSDGNQKMESINSTPEKNSLQGAGLLSVTVVGADDVEGKTHTNPYAIIHFRGEERKTKVIHTKPLAFSNSDHMFKVKVLSHEF